MPKFRRALALAAVPALLALPGAWPGGSGAAAAEEQATHCDWADTGLVEPGFTLERRTGTYSTAGETGTITCDGPIQGQMPSGPGTVGFEATYGVGGGASCQSGGQGAYAGFFTFPTAGGGRIHGIDYGTFNFGPLPRSGGVYGGSFAGELFSGTFTSGIVEGDCVTGVTKVFFDVKGAAVAVPRGKKL